MDKAPYQTCTLFVHFFLIFPPPIPHLQGTVTTLNEDDIWNLSPSLQSRPLYIKFSDLKRSTLLRRLWAANSLDLILDFSLTFVSILFNYLGPFFLKRILDSLDPRFHSTPEMRSQAYIYAFLAFLSTVCKVGDRYLCCIIEYISNSLAGTSRRTAPLVWPAGQHPYPLRTHGFHLRQSIKT